MRRLTILVVVLFGMLLAILPTQAATQTCFPQTGQCMSGRFQQYWNQNGGLAVFGYPITPVRNEVNRDTGATYQTQWFERNRFEFHPDQQPPFDVLLGRLGDDRLRQQGRDWQTFPKADPNKPYYFAQTGHAIDGKFWNYWHGHGLNLGDPGMSERESVALFGYPISEPQIETNANGDTVFTQWFERARFEWNPDKPMPYDVLLGLLGVEVGPPRLAAVYHQQ